MRRLEIRAVWYEDENSARSVPLDGWQDDPDKGEGWPDAYGIYGRRADGELIHVKDYGSASEADNVAQTLQREEP